MLNTGQSNQYAKREPSASKMGAEVLKQVNYPTGGYTAFEFEPHDYYAYIPKPADVNYTGNTAIVPINNANQEVKEIASGLRIKKITSSPDGGVTTLEKTYKYVKNYGVSGSALSSGILAGKPKYFDQYVGSYQYPVTLTPNPFTCPSCPLITVPGTLTFNSYYYMTEQSLNLLNLTNGSPVTYSEVTEVNKDNSYTIYKFSNYDNSSYCDRKALKAKTLNNTTVISPSSDPIIDYGTLRGKLLEQRLHNSSNQTVHKTVNEYTTILEDVKAIKAIRSQWVVLKYNAQELRASSYLIHTSPVYLLKSTSTDYYYAPITQAVSEMTVITQNEYDGHQNIKTQTVTNLNNTETQSNVTTTYSYAYNPTNITLVNPTVSETVAGTKQLMLDKFMIGIPLETKNNFNKGGKVEYKNFGTKILPFIYATQNRITPTQFDEQFRIDVYSDYDQPSITTQKGFISVSYNWNNGLMTQKAIGVSPSRLVWTFNYDPTKRLLTEKTNENGLKTKFTLYDGYRRLKSVKDRMQADDSDPQATMEYDYHLKNGAADNNYIQTKATYANGVSVNATLPVRISKQFMDGLGRTFMSYRQGYTQDNKHQKTYMTYDALGRPDKSYQPFGSLDPDVNLTGDAANLALSKYVQSTYEASPLSRPLTQIMEDGQKVTMSYGTNTGTDVRQFTGTSSTAFNTPPTVPTSAAFYAANTLSKTCVWNENATTYLVSDANTKIGRTDVFKDKLGRVVLTRKYVNAVFEEVNTYNVYDNYGNLVMVIPPGAEVNGTITTDLTFQYIYDNQNRLRGKKVPNAAWQYFYYDNRDLLVLTQDGNMRASSSPYPAGTKYLGTEYDNLGRVVKTGFLSVAGDPSVYLQSNIVTIDEATYLTKNVYFQDKNWVSFTYNRVLGASGVTPPKATVRTEYDQVRPGVYNYKGFPYWVNQETLYGFDDMNQGYNGAGQANYFNRYSFVGYEDNYSNFARTWGLNTYDQSGRLKSSSNFLTNAVTSTSITTDTINKFTYDVQDRLTQKDIGKTSGKFLQTTNYAYNARGWLTNINGDPSFTGNAYDYPIFNCTDGVVNNVAYNNTLTFPAAQYAPFEDNTDLFKEVIRYDNPELLIPNIGSTTTPQYNGNISQIKWQVAGREIQAYTFSYDNLDRMTDANYADIHTGTGTVPYSSKGWASKYASDNKYQEKVSYDLRGNIKTLQRNGLTGTMSQANNGLLYGCFGQIDNLTYNYDPANTNRLQSVTDGVGGVIGKKGFAQNVTGTAYGYDANGNLIVDRNKNISNIEYNYLNLPVRIVFTKETTTGGMTTIKFTGQIEFLYSATGVKLQKRTSTSIDPAMGTVLAWAVTNYSNGAEYDGSNNLVRLQHTEGSIVKDGTGALVYEYVLRDHLGNTRVTFGDADNNGLVINSDIKQINSFYPFGLNMEGPWNGAGGANKYQFGGKELNSDFGLNWEDFGARFYDPAVGRWQSIDVFADKYNQTSAYAYVLNSPINAIDPDGKRTYFIAGGTNDKGLSSTGYPQLIMSAFSNAGISDVRQIDAHSQFFGLRTILDINFALGEFGRIPYYSIEYNQEKEHKPGGLDFRVTEAVSKIESDLKSNPLKDGEQFNLTGYSMGSVVVAQSTLILADKGQKINNLVLIGSTIDPQSTLGKTLYEYQNAGKIGKVIYQNTTGDEVLGAASKGLSWRAVLNIMKHVFLNPASAHLKIADNKNNQNANAERNRMAQELVKEGVH
jgi:RHS repeat-associated protein